MIQCSKCLGAGLPDVCPECGTVSYASISATTTKEIDDSKFRIPTYYKQNLWDSSKLQLTQNQYLNAILKLIDKMVVQTNQGGKLNSSYAILMPYGYGKKTAMFSIIQYYLEHNYTVAPVVDVASLAVMENNFRLNEKESVKAWTELINSDLVCVYGVDFSARYHTMKLFLNLCSIRGLQGRPTLLFAENSLKDLRNPYVPDNLNEDTNNSDIGCRLSRPYILDGIKEYRRNSK